MEQLIDRADEDSVMANLWGVLCAACTAAVQSDPDTQGDMPRDQQYRALAIKMEFCIQNYGIGHGGQMFPFFETFYRTDPYHNEDIDFTKWPTRFLQWIKDDIKGKMPDSFDDKWIASLKVTHKQAKDLPTLAKEQLHIGFKIHENTEKTKSMLVNHLNKHWPKSEDEFKSGQTKSGLLKMIRKHFFYEIVAGGRALDNARQQYSRLQKADPDNIILYYRC